MVKASSLDQARNLSAQIEQRTGVKVLSPTVNDNLYPGNHAVLNLALTLVLETPNLETKSVQELGALVRDSLTKAMQEHSDPAAFLSQFIVSDAQERFCALASEECNLFSKQISEPICNVNVRNLFY